MNDKSSSSITLRFFLLAVALVLAAALTVSFFTLREFERELVPQMERKALAVGATVTAVVATAVDYGVPFEAMPGTEDLLNTSIRDTPEVDFMAIVDPAGRVLYTSGTDSAAVARTLEPLLRGEARAGDQVGLGVDLGQVSVTSQPITGEFGTIGTLYVGVDKAFVQNNLLEILLDVVTLLFVTFLITFEVVLFLINHLVSGPISALSKAMARAREGEFSLAVRHKSGDEVGRLAATFNAFVERVNRLYQQRSAGGAAPDPALAGLRFAEGGKPRPYHENLLVYIRMPLFLFVFAESLSLSFFPIFVEQRYEPLFGLSKEMVIGLPIALFMLIWALSQPTGGIWSDRVGRRTAFLASALCTAVGLIGTGQSADIVEVLIWRSVTAVGYGVAFITCQAYIAENTTPENRSQGMAVFIVGFMSASICGAAVGGIMSDRIGFEWTFYLSSGLAVVSALFVLAFIRPQERDPATVRPKLRFAHITTLKANPRFLVLTLGAAIPAKLILTGFLYYLTPLYLLSLDNSQSTIGRIMMCYGLAMVFLSPISARLADRFRARRSFIFWGGLLSGIGVASILLFGDTWAVLFSVACLGIGQAMSAASLLGTVPVITQEEGRAMGTATVLGVFRLLERLGSVIGPFLAAALVASYDYPTAIAGTAAVVIAGSLIFGAVFYAMFNPQARTSAAT